MKLLWRHRTASAKKSLHKDFLKRLRFACFNKIFLVFFLRDVELTHASGCRSSRKHRLLGKNY